MLTRIKDILRKITFIPSNGMTNKPMLGRWCILHKEFNNRKIDMANIDHCGTCHYDYKKDTQKPTKDAVNSSTGDNVK